MKLEGSLDAFGLPDIFQLLSLTKKTGGLHLRSGASAGVVYFADGAVTGADSDLARQTLARRLVGSGTVTDEALVSAVKRAGSDGIGVGRALLDAGAVGPDLLREAAAEVAHDAVFDLLRWPEGDFAFSPDAVNPDDVGLHVPTDQLVAQAWTRQEALDSASDVIGSPELVLSMTTLLDHDPELTRTDWSLVALADGQRTVGEIVDLTGLSYYSVVPSLATLVRGGLLQAAGDSPDHLGAVRRLLDILVTLETDPTDPAHHAASDRAAGTSTRSGSAVHVPAPAPGRTAPTASSPLRADSPNETALPDRASEPVGVDQRAQAVPVVADVPPVPASASQTDHRAETGAHSGASTGVDIGGPVHDLVSTIGGPNIPENVVPPRPEPFLARRQPEHPEVDAPGVLGRDGFGASAQAAATRVAAGSVFSQPSGGNGSGSSMAGSASSGAGGGAGGAGGAVMTGGVGGVNGSAAMAADPESAALIERDPSVNRSLLLRLIAGVRGL